MSPLLLRWGRFNVVGALGVGVQVSVLAVLKSSVGLDYLASTALAVEVAVLHNYYWHQRWTWGDRPRGSHVARLARFNLSTGAVSILSNLVFMGVFVRGFHIHYVLANVMAIAVTSVLNFSLADRLVWRD